MANTAVLVGNSQYQSLGALSCCHDDLGAMRELLEATEKYSEIEIIENTNADDLKSRMRTAIDKIQSKEELFFYFTGHGCQQEEEFYYCATNFDSKRPNETGLSTTELHTLLRLADVNLVVKVIDACNSGTLLVKANGEFQSHQKHEFNNLIQISSCRQSQNSLIGEPLSVFTEKFRAAALRKKEGVVYYTDIVNTLRDEFIHNDDQTPFFVFQVTGREKFVENAKYLDELRNKLTTTTESSLQSESGDQQTSSTPTSLRDLLEDAERSAATPERIKSLVDTFFDNLIQKVSNDKFSDFFDLEIVEHPDFSEPAAEAFVTRILSKESRADEFVTATISREPVRRPWHMMNAAALLGTFGDEQRYRDVYDLHLNCKMQRAQLKMKLTPKYLSLKQLVTIVTCAPSLQNCYVFEIGSQNSLTDFGEFDVEGNESIRRWYKFQWSENTDWIVEKIVSKLDEIVQEHLKQTEQRLTKE